MKNKKLKFGFIALAIIALHACTCGKEQNDEFDGFKYKYEIVITFCDNRPPVKTFVLSNLEKAPSSADIRTENQAKPVYVLSNAKWVNVCDVKSIRVRKKDSPKKQKEK